MVRDLDIAIALQQLDNHAVVNGSLVYIKIQLTAHPARTRGEQTGILPWWTILLSKVGWTRLVMLDVRPFPKCFGQSCERGDLDAAPAQHFFLYPSMDRLKNSVQIFLFSSVPVCDIPSPS